VIGRGWVQETYETASKHAAIRAKELRAAGYQVTTAALGLQRTSLGLIKMTMLDIRIADYQQLDNLPEVQIERL
jgi:hypothetical protein